MSAMTFEEIGEDWAAHASPPHRDGHTPCTKIVLAVDISTPAARARGTVAGVAAPGAEVIVLHIHEVDRPESDAVDDRIECIAANLQDAGFSVVVITSHALPHHVAEAIAEVAREVRADMIVVGGGGPLLRTLTLGGVSGDLKRRASCPVLVDH